MKIVFLGATELGYKCCRLIIESKLAEVCGIFTIPKEFNISYSNQPVNNVNFADFRDFEIEFGIPVKNVTGKMIEYEREISDLKPDLILVIGWYYMIPKQIRELAPLGCAGMHASLLPKYRGGAPLVWAIINGETMTGLSFFYLEEGTDTGDIIAQEKIEIKNEDHIDHILLKVNDAALRMIKTYIPMLANGSAPRIRQNEEEATYFSQRKPEDGEINWNRSPEEIYNFIRAQSKPYPGAYTFINGKKITIWNAEITEL
ncbi:MAG: methionyl-tRNA formyltransferase [Ignavibacteria bacterium]|nr:methionyl-tRNA formyltransferase [Ignavibacteria bacterium]